MNVLVALVLAVSSPELMAAEMVQLVLSLARSLFFGTGHCFVVIAAADCDYCENGTVD